MREKIIARLKNELKFFGISQVELTSLVYGSENIKTNQSTISRIFSGSLACSLDKILELISSIGSEPYIIVKSGLKKNFKAAFERLPIDTKQLVMNEIEQNHRLFRDKTEAKKDADIECILWVENYINNYVELITAHNKAILIIEKSKERTFSLN